MIHLLRQYKADTHSSLREQRHVLQAKMQVALLPGLVDALHDCFSLTQEMFASPLNVHPRTAQFWTAVSSDTDFHGAKFDAFSAAWAGAALVHPEYDDACLARAAKWALAAATRRDGPACLFIFVAPRWPTKAFHKALSASSAAHPLCSIEAKRLLMVQHAPGPAHSSTAAAPWPMDVWIITNKDGMQRFYRKEQLHKLQAALAASCAPGTNAGRLPSTAHAQLHPPTEFTWLVSAASHPNQQPQRQPHTLRRGATAPAPAPPPPPPRAPWPQPVPLQSRTPRFPNAADVVYTDGSKKQKCGCGVYCAAQPASNASFRFTGDQTVLRAELTAISYALHAHDLRTALTLATDSLTSLQLVPQQNARQAAPHDPAPARPPAGRHHCYAEEAGCRWSGHHASESACTHRHRRQRRG